MEIAQMLPEANVNTLIILTSFAIIGYLINNKLTNIEATLKQHGDDIQAIKINQARIETEIERLLSR